MNTWRAVRVSPLNNGLLSQNDEENGRSFYIIYRSQSHGEPKKDNVIYIGKIWNSGLYIDDLAFLNEG